MKSSPLRFILSLSLGVFIAYFVTIFFQSIAPILFGYQPLSEGADIYAFEKYLITLPMSAMLGLIGASMLGVFFGSYAAARIANQKKMEAALGVGFFCAVIYLFMIIAFSFPLDLAAALLIVIVPSGYLAGKVAMK